jgi:hypothetical protein
MLIEFQITAQRLLNLVVARLRLIPVCSSDVFAIGGIDCVLDHVWLPDGGGSLLRAPNPQNLILTFGALPQSFSFKPLQIRVPVNLFIKTLAQFSVNPPDSSYAHTPQIHLVANLTSSGSYFCASYDSVDFGPFLPILQQDAIGFAKLTQTVNAIGSQLGQVCGNIGLGALSGVLGALAVTNVGISADEPLSRVALRFEVAGPSTPDPTVVADWKSFFSGILNSQPLDSDWSIFIEKALLLNALTIRISKGIADAEAQFLLDPVAAKKAGKTDFHLDTDLTTTWVPAGAAGVIIEIDFSGTLLDVCPITDDDVSVAVTTTSNLDFENGALAVHTTLDWNAEDWDIFLCALPFGILGGLNLPLTATFEDIFITKGDIPSPGAGCVVVDANHSECHFPINLPPLTLGTPYSLGTFVPSGLVGLDEGAVLQGNLAVMQVGPAFLSIVFSGWGGWGAQGDCVNLEYACTGQFTLSAFGPPANPPVEICTIKVIELRPNDIEQDLAKLPNVFAPDPISWAPAELTLTLLPEQLLDPNAHPWFKEYYPIFFVFETSAGWSSFLIPPPPPVPAGWEQAFQTSKILKIADCEKPETSFFGNLGAFDFHWEVDPPEGVQVAQLWQILAKGLAPGESIGAGFAAANPLAVATATTDGIAQLSAFVEPTDPAISVMAVTMQKKGAAHTGQRALIVSQTQFIERAAMRVDQSSLHLSMGNIAGFDALLSTSALGLDVYDLSIPTVPTLSLRIPETGLRGAMTFAGRILVWGSDGISFLSILRNHRYEVSLHSYSGAVRDLVRWNELLYALTPTGVEIWTTDLTREASVAVDRGNFISLTSSDIVVGCEKELVFFDYRRDPRAPQAGRTLAVEDVGGLGRPPTANGSRAVFVRSSKGGGRILQIGRDQQANQVARFDRDPWFWRAAQRAGTLVRADQDGRTLRLYTRDKTVTVAGGGTRAAAPDLVRISKRPQN